MNKTDTPETDLLARMQAKCAALHSRCNELNAQIAQVNVDRDNWLNKAAALKAQLAAAQEQIRVKDLHIAGLMEALNMFAKWSDVHTYRTAMVSLDELHRDAALKSLTTLTEATPDEGDSK
jgi:septal ring factor EnvC (AmiA/AmiB activator)